MRRCCLSVGALVASLVEARAAVEAVVVPLPVALAILGLVIAIAAIIWGLVGIRHFVRWLSARGRGVQAVIYVLLLVVVFGLAAAWMSRNFLEGQWNWVFTLRPYQAANFDGYLLTTERERALKSLESFRECAKDCPEMVVIPAGRFMMGSPASEKFRNRNEDDGHGRQHEVRIARPFAVARDNVKFTEWGACATIGGCPMYRGENFRRFSTWSVDDHAMIDVGWDDAQSYASWLSRMTGRRYRLLTEAEWEYAARAGTTTAYYWGDSCDNCESKRDYFARFPWAEPNAFGLSGVMGYVFEWVEDCYQDSYEGAPADGSPWIRGECTRRVVRGSPWSYGSRHLRSASRDGKLVGTREDDLSFRVARTLSP